jgi:hypothetical protein
MADDIGTMLELILKNQQQIKDQLAEIKAQTKKPNRKKREQVPETYVPGINKIAWDEYVSYRKRMHYKRLATVDSENAQRELISMARDDQEQFAIVRQTTNAGWQGLFPLKNGTHNGNTHERKTSASERATEHRKRAEKLWAEHETNGQYMGENDAHLRSQMDIGLRRDGDE